MIGVRPMRQYVLGVAVAVSGVLLAAACGGDDDGQPLLEVRTPVVRTIATIPPATATALARAPLDLPEETGLGPIYWRTLDAFQGVRAGEPYKVVLRVTSGYAAPQLPVIAEWLEGDNVLEFSALRAEPVGREDEGTFYVFSLELPDRGEWRVIAIAGEAQSSVRIRVQ